MRQRQPLLGCDSKDQGYVKHYILFFHSFSRRWSLQHCTLCHIATTSEAAGVPAPMPFFLTIPMSLSYSRTIRAWSTVEKESSQPRSEMKSREVQGTQHFPFLWDDSPGFRLFFVTSEFYWFGGRFDAFKVKSFPLLLSCLLPRNPCICLLNLPYQNITGWMTSTAEFYFLTVLHGTSKIKVQWGQFSWGLSALQSVTFDKVLTCLSLGHSKWMVTKAEKDFCHIVLLLWMSAPLH